MEVFKLKKYDLDDVKRLIELANKNDLSVLEIETKKGRRIRIEKNKPVAPAVAFNATALSVAPYLRDANLILFVSTTSISISKFWFLNTFTMSSKSLIVVKSKPWIW